MDEMGKMATAMIKSKMFGFKTVEEALSIMLIAQAEGRPAALAARDYHVIQGRPALKADAMLARFQQEGGIVEWDEYTDTKVTGRFSHPKSSPKPIAITWTIEQAKKIGLATKDNWRNYPRAMMRARVISEGVRTVYPGIAVGIYTVEETQDFMKERDITPTADIDKALTEDQREKVDAVADAMREWINQGSIVDAWTEMDNAAFDTEEKIFLWTHFDSRARRQLNDEGERQRIKRGAIENKSTISDAQKKRLEARIGELKLDREKVKAYCASEFNVEHFANLTSSQYSALDSIMDSPDEYYIFNSPSAAPASPASSSPVEAQESPPSTDAGQPSTADTAKPAPFRTASSDEGVGQGTVASSSTHKQIHEALGFASKSVTARFDLLLKGRKIDELDEAAAGKALAWLSSELDK